MALVVDGSVNGRAVEPDELGPLLRERFGLDVDDVEAAALAAQAS